MDVTQAVPVAQVASLALTPTAQILSMLLTFASTVIGLFMTYLLARLSQQSTVAALARTQAAVKVSEVAAKQEVVAAKVDSVKEVLAAGAGLQDRRLGDLKNTIEQTHVLVNSNMGMQLRLNKVATQRLADLTKDPVDIEAAALAAKLFAAHEAAQAKADAVAPLPGGSNAQAT